MKVVNSQIAYILHKRAYRETSSILEVLTKDYGRVTLMARGRAISKAVDVAEVVRNQFIANLSVSDINIGTEELETEDGGTRNISNIAIMLSRG